VYIMLAKEMDGGESALKKMEKDQVFMLCLDRLRSEIGYVLKSYTDLNVQQADYPKIVKECVLNGSNASNPQPMEEHNYYELLEMLENDKIVHIENPCLEHARCAK